MDTRALMDSRFLANAAAAGLAALALAALPAQAQHRAVAGGGTSTGAGTSASSSTGDVRGTFGAPSASGLAPPGDPQLTSPFPAGLPTPFPANVTSGSNPTTAAQFGTGTGAAVPAAAGVTAGGIANARTQMGAPPSHPGPYTALEIARSFLGADVDNSGDLTRAEASRLTIMPMSFEDMDTNHDGLVSRSEYEESFR